MSRVERRWQGPCGDSDEREVLIVTAVAIFLALTHGLWLAVQDSVRFGENVASGLVRNVFYGVTAEHQFGDPIWNRQGLNLKQVILDSRSRLGAVPCVPVALFVDVGPVGMPKRSGPYVIKTPICQTLAGIEPPVE